MQINSFSYIANPPLPHYPKYSTRKCLANNILRETCSENFANANDLHFAEPKGVAYRSVALILLAKIVPRCWFQGHII